MGRTESGMKIICNRENPFNSNIRRQKTVESVCKVLWDFPFRIEVCKHLSGMHSGIGTAGARALYWFTQHGSQRLFEFLLDRNFIWLDLVTEIVFTVVGKLNKIPQNLKLRCKNIEIIPNEIE